MMVKHSKTVRPYRKQRDLMNTFNEVAESVTKEYGLLVGLDRLSGYVDTLGAVWAPAWSLHINGVCFRVESIPSAIAYLNGWRCGRDFLESSLGHRGITAGECKVIINEILTQWKKTTAARGGDAKQTASAAE